MLTAAAVVSLVAFSGACKKNADAPRPAPIGPNPSAAPMVPGPTPAAPGMPPAAAGPGGTIVGKITLPPENKAGVTPNDVVYLVARRVADNPTARGSLVAVKRFTATSFPIDFTLGAADMMFKNGAFEGDLTLSARIDKDGDPMTRKKGDVFGTLDKVKVGATGVQVNLDHVQKEDESLMGAAPPPGGMPPGHP
jgi:hypothetical protein